MERVPDEVFSWRLSRGQVKAVAALLVKAEQMFRLVEPGCASAETVAALLTELRVQLRDSSSFADPCPQRPLGPSWEEVRR